MTQSVTDIWNYKTGPTGSMLAALQPDSITGLVEERALVLAYHNTPGQ